MMHYTDNQLLLAKHDLLILLKMNNRKNYIYSFYNLRKNIRI